MEIQDDRTIWERVEGFFSGHKRAEPEDTQSEPLMTLENFLLEAGIRGDVITRQMAENIPALSGCVELISNTVASLPVQLYRAQNGQTETVQDDPRIKILNEDTGDTLNGFQFKKALVEDFLYMGNGYAYIRKRRNIVRGLHYVPENQVSIVKNADPIFKAYKILVNGGEYWPHQFVKVTRCTEDGVTGKGVVETNPEILAIAYNYMHYENKMAKTGGNKKGFVKAKNRLGKDEMTELKKQWTLMYSGNSENCVVLNNGLDFQESGSTSTEMQLNESKVQNGNEICKIMGVPPSLFSVNGQANEDDFTKFVKMAVLPILKNIETALNKDLLLETEKGSFYFEFDTKEILKAEIDKRYAAYQTAIKNNILTINETRELENKPPIDIFKDRVVLGLDAVLMDTKSGEIYTPNTGQTSNLNQGGGEKPDANRDKE